MVEGIKRKIVHSGTTKAALETAKLAIAPTAQAAITASDILLTGGLSIPTEWAVRKLVNKAQGIQEIEYIHKKFGRMRATIKVKVLPDGTRQVVKVLDRRVIKPTQLYKKFKKDFEDFERRRKMEEEIRKKMPKEASSVARRMSREARRAARA